MNPRAGNGKKINWIRRHLSYRDQECLIWPFLRNPNGYAILRHETKTDWAHRFMCRMVHGEPPTDKHVVAHTCGRGNQGCVNPVHLTWKTRSENNLDQRAHGTARNPWWGKNGKVTADQVREIRALKGKMTATEIAKLYPVITANTVRTILRGVTWRNI